jgi:hypothetical protein
MPPTRSNGYEPLVTCCTLLSATTTRGKSTCVYGRRLAVADNLVTSIRRMVGQSTAPGQRTLLEHAAIQAADEIERLRAAGGSLAWCSTCVDPEDDDE